MTLVRCLIVAFVVGVLLVGIPAVAQPPTGQKIALLVGVNQYDKPGFSNLQFAERDVDALAVELKRHGFVTTVLKGSSAGADRATRANIEATLARLVGPLGKSDLMLVACSGHGQQLKVRVRLPDGREIEREDGFYCPVDAVQNNPATQVSLSHVIDNVLAPNVGKKLLLIDACRDVPADPSRGAKGIQGKVIALPEDTAVFFSCRAGQRSFEKRELQHGLFTYCVLEALRGQAAVPGQRDISWTDVVAFVDRRMASDEIRKLLGDDSDQEPIGAGGVGRTVIARITPTPVPTPSPSETPPILSAPFTPAAAKSGQESRAKSLGKNVIEKNSIGMDLVLIPPGSFRMRSPDGEDGHEADETQVDVTLTQAFWLARTEVTQGQWQQVMGTAPWKGQTYVQEGSDYPATYVSWDDATEFCQKLSQRDGKTYRLPTEAEWEWSCRAGTTSRFSFGDSDGDLGRYGWYDKNAWDIDEKYAHRVGLKLANPFGLSDMHGNVWEWCQDLYADKLPGGPNPVVTSGGSYRVFRGGGWYSAPAICRSANRDWNSPDNRFNYLGFRPLAVQSR